MGRRATSHAISQGHLHVFASGNRSAWQYVGDFEDWRCDGKWKGGEKRARM